MNNLHAEKIMVVGYISADCPFISKKEQVKKLEEFGCESIIVKSFAKTGLPFVQFVAQLKAGSTIVVARMDCIVSSWRHLRNIIMQVQQKNCTLTSLDEPWANTTAERGILMLEVLIGIEDLEKRFIRHRMSCGRQKAISAGCRIGRPRKLTQQHFQAMAQARAKGLTLREIAQQHNVSISMVSRILQKLKVIS